MRKRWYHSLKILCQNTTDEEIELLGALYNQLVFTEFAGHVNPFDIPDPIVMMATNNPNQGADPNPNLAIPATVVAFLGANNIPLAVARTVDEILTQSKTFLKENRDNFCKIVTR